MHMHAYRYPNVLILCEIQEKMTNRGNLKLLTNIYYRRRNRRATHEVNENNKQNYHLAM